MDHVRGFLVVFIRGPIVSKDLGLEDSCMGVYGFTGVSNCPCHLDDTPITVVDVLAINIRAEDKEVSTTPVAGLGLYTSSVLYTAFSFDSY